MPVTITISGSRATVHRSPGEYNQLFVEYLAPFAAETAHFYLGGAGGIDSLALLWLTSAARPQITVAVPWYGRRPAG